MTEETAIKKEIRDWLRLNGWFVYPILQGLGAYKGINDLTACKDKVVLFIEVKTKKGKLSPYQKDFKNDIESHDCNYVLARCYEDVENYLQEKKDVIRTDNKKDARD